MRGGGSRLLSPDQLGEMCDLRERGWSPQRIADHFADQGVKISASAIAWQCMVQGADAPPRLRGKSVQASQPYNRNGSIVRPFSKAEDRKLRLWAGRVRKVEIARRLGRKAHSVHGRLLALARLDARAEDGGQ